MCLSGRGGGGVHVDVRASVWLCCALSFFEIESPVGCPLMKLQRWWPRQRLVAGQSISWTPASRPSPSLTLPHLLLFFFASTVSFSSFFSRARGFRCGPFICLCLGWNAQGLAVPVPILHSFFWFLIVSYLPGLEIGFFGGGRMLTPHRL